MLTTLLIHEFKINFRTKEALFSMLSFGIVLMVSFVLSFQISDNKILFFLPGFFWITVLFVSVLGISRMFSHELSFRAITLLASGPVNRGLIFFSKTIIGTVYLAVVEIALLGCIWFFFHISFFNQIYLFFGLILIGNISIMVTSVFISGLTLSSKMSNVLVPLLVFPLLSPVIISLTKSTLGILQNSPFSEIQVWVLLVLTYCVLFTLLGYGLFDYLTEE